MSRNRGQSSGRKERRFNRYWLTANMANKINSNRNNTKRDIS
jgi:hypothetical protein